jgi:hypothetical protein
LGEVSERLQPTILGIINELYLRLFELETKKLTIYLKYKFLEDEKADLKEAEYKYVLPLSTRIPLRVIEKGQPGHESAG